MIFRMNELASTRDRPGRVPIGRSMIYKQIKTGKFPKPNWTFGRTKGWTSDLIDQWNEEQRTD